MPSLRSKRDSSIGLTPEPESISSSSNSSPSLVSKLTPSKSKRNSFFSRSSPSTSPSQTKALAPKSSSSPSPSTIVSKALPTVELNGQAHPVQSREEGQTEVFSGYESAKRDLNGMNGLIFNGSNNGIVHLNGNGIGKMEEGESPPTSLPPSMTTGSTSTSASIESLESIKNSNDKALRMKISRSLASNEKEALLQPVAQTIPPPTSHSSSSDGTALLHEEFGYCSNESYRYTSEHRLGDSLPSPIEEEPSYFIVLSTYISYLILIVIGHMRDFFGKRLFPASYHHLVETNGYAALNSDFDSFYTRCVDFE